MIDEKTENSMIVDALRIAKGNQNEAAKTLGWNPEKLSRKLSQRPELKLLANEKTPPNARTSDEGIHREAKLPPATIDKKESALVKGIEAEEKMLKEGLQALKLSARGTEIAESLMGFAGVEFAPVLHMVHAGVVKDFIGTLEDIEAVNGDLESVKLNDEEYGLQAVLREDRARLRDHARKVYELIQKGELIKAKIEVEREKNKAGGKKSKPAFSPLAIKADNVTINEKSK